MGKDFIWELLIRRRRRKYSSSQTRCRSLHVADFQPLLTQAVCPRLPPSRSLTVTWNMSLEAVTGFMWSEETLTVPSLSVQLNGLRISGMSFFFFLSDVKRRFRCYMQIRVFNLRTLKSRFLMLVGDRKTLSWKSTWLLFRNCSLLVLQCISSVFVLIWRSVSE